ncbi:MAG TPA: DUF456 family protein [Phycisphaerales bacterium]|nr:DUF456 family protein [Phycisphaerales bacterium]
MDALAGLIVAAACLLGVALTAATLPGIWLAILVAAACHWWRGDLYSYWTLGVAAGIGLLGEIAEFAASAAGAAKAGGSRRGALGAVIGAVAGAIFGSALIPIPVVGTILGAAAGAGAGALLAERHAGKTWTQSTRIGAGAATGRLVATILKVLFAVIVALILTVGAFL